MKIYRVSDPETLKELAAIVKDPGDAAKVTARAVAWSTFVRKGKEDAMDVRIELSRTALLVLICRDGKKILGALKLNAAREKVKGMVEIHEDRKPIV